MTTRHYHTPPPPISTRVRCPICREVVYSRAGIHPQCAMRQADPPRPKPKPKLPGSPGQTDQAGRAPEQTEVGVVAISPESVSRSAPD